MEIILSILLSIVAVVIFILLTNGLPKSVNYMTTLRRYKYIEPENLIEFKKAIFDSNRPLPTQASFTLGKWNYYHFSCALSNPSENISIDLYEYDKAIIWHWIRTHNNELRDR